MSDLISRQAAIGAMWKALYAYEDLTEKQFMEHEELELEDWFQHRIFVQRMHEECMKAVNSLPSADRELFKDGTLKVNVQNGAEVSRVLVWGDDGYGGLYYADDRPSGEWIPCSERLPSKEGRYMVTQETLGGDFRFTGLFYYGKPMMPNCKVKGACWYRSDDEWGDVVYEDSEIVAWMPLPEPYREDDANEK